MNFPTPKEDTVAQSHRALKKVQRDEHWRATQRLQLASQGCLMVAPGRW